MLARRARKPRAQKIMAKNYYSSPKKSVRTTSYPAAILNLFRCEALMRSPRPPPRRVHLFLFTICGLFTKKFELYFKDSPPEAGKRASAPTRSPRYLFSLPRSAGLGLWPCKKSVRTDKKSP